VVRLPRPTIVFKRWIIKPVAVAVLRAPPTMIFIFGAISRVTVVMPIIVPSIPIMPSMLIVPWMPTVDL
jgi:hypothetical protein